jgi:hypothetical protein
MLATFLKNVGEKILATLREKMLATLLKNVDEKY